MNIRENMRIGSKETTLLRSFAVRWNWEIKKLLQGEVWSRSIFWKMGRTKLYGSEHPLASDLTQYHIPLQLPQYTLPFGSLCHKQNVPFSQPVLWNFAYLYGSAPCTPSWAGSRGDQIPITDVPCSFSFMGYLSLDTYLLFSKMHFLGILKLESLLACVNDVNTLLLPQTIYGPCWPSNLVFYYVTTSPHTTWPQLIEAR